MKQLGHLTERYSPMFTHILTLLYQQGHLQGGLTFTHHAFSMSQSTVSFLCEKYFVVVYCTF